MQFPSGEQVALPSTLLNPGKSGPTQVHAPEQPTPYARLSDAQLERLAENLAGELEQLDAKPGGLTPSVADYYELLQMQVAGEMMRRMR